MTLTHDALVLRGERWLRRSAWVYATYQINGKTPKNRACCAVVLSEPSGASEQPDVIGWCQGGRSSLLIECKISRSDFLADQKKWYRTKSGSRFALGMYRFYLAPSGLLMPNEIPEGWGLLEAAGRRIKVIQQSAIHERDLTREMNVLWSECRKIQVTERGGRLTTKAGVRITNALEKLNGEKTPKTQGPPQHDPASQKAG